MRSEAAVQRLLGCSGGRSTGGNRQLERDDFRALKCKTISKPCCYLTGSLPGKVNVLKLNHLFH